MPRRKDDNENEENALGFLSKLTFWSMATTRPGEDNRPTTKTDKTDSGIWLAMFFVGERRLRRDSGMSNLGSMMADAPQLAAARPPAQRAETVFDPRQGRAETLETAAGPSSCYHSVDQAEGSS
jgi:hypothetical protein